MSDDSGRGGSGPVDHEAAEDYVPADDRIIGVVFWWSILVVGCIGALLVLLWLFLGRGGSAEEVVRAKDVVAPEVLVADVEVLPDVSFTDVTTSSGIAFVHESGAEGEKLLPETMGSGVAFFDSDRD
ncbi:MAG: hypothetical protein MK095_07470, partial [Phycisphaerales bacterium]|nr:hypothetical protein [Phycisphaerales bacterium]